MIKKIPLSFIASAVLISIPNFSTAQEQEQNLLFEQLIKEKNINKITGVQSDQNSIKKPLGGDSLLKSSNYKQNDIIDINKYIKVSLLDVVLETVSQSNNAKAAKEKLIQAKYNLDDAYAGYLPSIDGSYKTGRTRSLPGDDEEKDKYYGEENYKLTIKQNIYSGGATQTEIESLEKKYEVAKNNYKMAITKEIENAVKAYFDVLFNYKALNINLENMNRLNEVLEIVTIKFDSGAVSIGDLSSIKASVSNAQSKLIKVQSKFNESLEFYKYIVGDEFIYTFPYEDNFDIDVDNFDAIVEKAIVDNININNYKLNIEAEKFKLLNNKSTFRPKIDLELSANRMTDQEDYVEDEIDYKAQLSISYNFYNGGKDENKFLKTNSVIRELNFRMQEEIKKLKWTLSKLHTSVVSLKNAMKSTNDEVSASIDMVNAYWEGFKLGEQDLQVLLQGQRQLNSAQLELINYKNSSINDYFKILSSTGDILEYFRLDIEASNFIDFTKSDYKNLLKNHIENIKKDELFKTEDKLTQELEEKSEEKQIEQIEDEPLKTDDVINEELPVETEVSDTLKDMIDFENEFLNSDENKWTIRINYFDQFYQALDFVNENNISKESFIFDQLVNDKIKKEIAYGIFETKDEALEKSQQINTILNKNVSDIKQIKDIYKNFKDKKLTVKTKPKKVKPFQTDQNFKKKFLEAVEDYYTINITSLSSMDDAKELVEAENIYSDSFIFNYGQNNEWVKVVYGVFETYEKANEALNEKSNLKIKYESVIEKIKLKQELYHKYNTQENTQEIIKENNSTQVLKSDIVEELDQEQNITVKNEQNEQTPQLVEKIEKEPEVLKEVETKQPQKVEHTIKSFQQKFLEAAADFYTINLATFSSEELLERFEKQNSHLDDIMTYSVGEDKKYFKVIKGIYKTKEEAQEGIDNLSRILKLGKPFINKIGEKQKSYHKYNTQENTQEIIKENNSTQVLKTDIEDESAKKEFYYLHLDTIDENQLGEFIDRYQLNKDEIYTKRTNEGFKVYLGEFQDIIKAVERKKSIHPILYDKSKITKTIQIPKG